MKINILDYAMERVLSMVCSNEKWKPVVYLLKSLNEIGRNSKIHNKKILVVIRGLENWGHLLKRAKFKFEV